MDGAPGAHKRFLRHVLALAAVGHIARNQAHDLVLVFAHQQVESPRITLLYALDKRTIDFFFAHPGLSPLTRTSATRRCRTAKGAPKFIATPLIRNMEARGGSVKVGLSRPRAPRSSGAGARPAARRRHCAPAAGKTGSPAARRMHVRAKRPGAPRVPRPSEQRRDGGHGPGRWSP